MPTSPLQWPLRQLVTVYQNQSISPESTSHLPWPFFASENARKWGRAELWRITSVFILLLLIFRTTKMPEFYTRQQLVWKIMENTIYLKTKLKTSTLNFTLQAKHCIQEKSWTTWSKTTTSTIQRNGNTSRATRTALCIGMGRLTIDVAITTTETVCEWSTT